MKKIAFIYYGMMLDIYGWIVNRLLVISGKSTDRMLKHHISYVTRKKKMFHFYHGMLSRFYRKVGGLLFKIIGKLITKEVSYYKKMYGEEL